MRKWIQTVLTIFISLVVFIVPVKADIGPKPSVNLKFFPVGIWEKGTRTP